MQDHRRRIPPLLVLVLAGGCSPHADPGSAGGAEPQAPAKPLEATLTFDLPLGLALRVDGSLRGLTPLDPLVVSPGEHALELESPCGDLSATINAAPGALTPIGAQTFAALEIARLHVIAKTPQRQPAAVEVSLGDWKVPDAAAQPTQVPACKLRLRLVAPEGLGGFMEDIVFAPGESYVREVVLAPGPDMVRIAGARFRIGPPGPDHYDPSFDYEEAYEDFEGWPHIKTYEVDIPTFDIDRTEVTAEQFHACYEAGFCGGDPVMEGSTRVPSRVDRPRCNIDIFQALRPPKPGRWAHPANCVAGWEAKRYCEWVGKRLPTDVEWEFAARSRNPEYACSWGGGYSPKMKCDRSGFHLHQGTREGCSYPSDNTEQGLCDMIGGVVETVTRATVPGRPALRDCKLATVARGPAFGESAAPFEGGEQCDDMLQSPYAGFRCARDVGVAAVQR